MLLSGRHHDEKGDLKDWWTPESNERFLELSKCMVNQYNNFTLDAESGTQVCCPCRFLLPPHFNSSLTASGSWLITAFAVSTCLLSASSVLTISRTRFGPAVDSGVHSHWAPLSDASFIISEDDGCHFCRQPSCIFDLCLSSADEWEKHPGGKHRRQRRITAGLPGNESGTSEEVTGLSWLCG